MVKTEKSEDLVKERSSRKSKKKEKEKENVEKVSLGSRIERRLLVLPLEASLIAILLLVLLGAFYVVRDKLLAISGFSFAHNNAHGNCYSTQGKAYAL